MREMCFPLFLRAPQGSPEPILIFKIKMGAWFDHKQTGASPASPPTHPTLEPHRVWSPEPTSETWSSPSPHTPTNHQILERFKGGVDRDNPLFTGFCENF